MKKITIAMMVMFLAYSNAYAGDSLALYKEYLSALPNAKSIDDVYKYMSSEFLALIEKNPKKGDELFQIAKDIGSAGDNRITEEIKSDDNAVLKYDIPNGNYKPTVIEVTMKKENGLWKIANIEIRIISVI